MCCKIFIWERFFSLLKPPEAASVVNTYYKETHQASSLNNFRRHIKYFYFSKFLNFPSLSDIGAESSGLRPPAWMMKSRAPWDFNILWYIQALFLGTYFCVGRSICSVATITATRGVERWLPKSLYPPPHPTYLHCSHSYTVRHKRLKEESRNDIFPL